jgi:hypothetical protein
VALHHGPQIEAGMHGQKGRLEDFARHAIGQQASSDGRRIGGKCHEREVTRGKKKFRKVANGHFVKLLFTSRNLALVALQAEPYTLRNLSFHLA